MSADIEQLKNIHRVETEIEETKSKVKTVVRERKSLVEELAEAKLVAELSDKLGLARKALSGATRSDPHLAKLDQELSELRFNLKDLVEILSHHLVVYFQDTGRDVIKDSNEEARQIELKAKMGGKALDQEQMNFGEPVHANASN